MNLLHFKILITQILITFVLSYLVAYTWEFWPDRFRDYMIDSDRPFIIMLGLMGLAGLHAIVFTLMFIWN